jgi:3',5'-cyclic AMP phosphodiesterase CpdA
METTDFSFVHVADIHIGTPRSFRFAPAWNDNWETARRQIIELAPDFLLVGGDTTRDGSTHRFELEQVERDFAQLPFPVHVIPGNHEIGNKYAAGAPMSIQPAFLDRYSSVFGPSEWSFDVGNVRFSGCNAFLLGSGLPEERILRDWLEEQSLKPAPNRHVWIIHPGLFADNFDEPDWDPVADRRPWYFAMDNEPRHFLWNVFKATGTTHVITAHIHCRRHVRHDDIDIHFAPSTAFSQWNNRWPDGDPTLGFLRFEVDEHGIRREFVALDGVSGRKGYGPGGNPGPNERDYGLAWESPALDLDLDDDLHDD